MFCVLWAKTVNLMEKYVYVGIKSVVLRTLSGFSAAVIFSVYTFKIDLTEINHKHMH